MTQEQVARKVGRDRSSITNILRLLKLPAEIQQLVEEEKITMGHARALLPMEDTSEQYKLANRVVEEGLSVREVEKIVDRWKSQLEEVLEKEEVAVIDPNVKAAEQKLQRRFGTKVRIVMQKNGGRIQIDFHNNEELERLYDLLIK
jgi:ParB family chromosome partitioning protein